MKEYNELVNDLKFIDQITGYMQPDTKIELFLLGGSGCILAGYLERATKDFDVIDIGYSAAAGKLLNYLQPYDLLDLSHAEIALGFRERAVLLDKFVNIRVYVLSREDIIASKIGRFEKKDRQDIELLMKNADREKLLVCLKDMWKSITNKNRKMRYKKHLAIFLKEYAINLDMETNDV